jgi:hypothetical protein
VERAILGDAGIVDEHIDRAKLSLDLLDARHAGVERTDVPFVGGNAGLGLEFFRRGVIACVSRRDLVTGRLQRPADRRTDTPRSSRHQCNTRRVEFLSGGLFISRNYPGL